MEMALVGLLFHLCIAIIWTFLFFALYERFKINKLNWGLAGIGYGIIVWIGMNEIVLPLSNTSPLPQSAMSIITGAVILMICIGLPISYGARKHYKGR